MNKKLALLLLTQFISAFADNAILFTIIAIVMQSNELAPWYIPALQSLFLIAFIIFAPWVGAFADYYAKAKILLFANLIKAAGVILLLLNIEPLLSYALVGVGAALYSPAKYGILPELVDQQKLVKANSLIEGSTILAILLGMVIGAKIADHSISLALNSIIILFMISAILSLFLPNKRLNKKTYSGSIKYFSQHLSDFLSSPRARFSVAGGSLFWLAAATLRVILIAWAPLILLSKNASEIAELTLFLAIGIIIGSALVPRLISLENIRRTCIPALFMGVFIILLSFTHTLWEARSMLLAIGCAGGVFIVPINAALQEIGYQSIGSGSAVALQNFFQNIAMLIGVGCYTYARSINISPVITLFSLGLFIFISTFVMSLLLTPAQQKTH
jgi:LPLT family lysophospholipid transporter-like MFS transporter